MMVIVQQAVECELAGETEVLGENLPICPPQIPQPDPSSNPGRRGRKLATNRLEILLHIQEVAVKHLELRH
jgi:hypothetical protein